MQELTLFCQALQSLVAGMLRRIKRLCLKRITGGKIENESIRKDQ